MDFTTEKISNRLSNKGEGSKEIRENININIEIHSV